MSRFSQEDLAQCGRFDGALGEVIERLAPMGDKGDIEKLKVIHKRFGEKVENFSSNERKLNIGVIGQVKAGKSSFLNTLLFDGKEILPKASTPKTANLIKMEYAPENAMVVEYYEPKEWQTEVVAYANMEGTASYITVAKELLKAVQESGIDVKEYLGQESKPIPFASYEDLLGKLNDYVGADGKMMPLVKAVTLRINRPDFEGISIVDTPGLNDPIQSRTQRTNEFMEECDVVFFLSQAGSFVDQSDWMLLTTKLPQKGAERIVLIASKYDSALLDVLRTPPKEGAKKSPFAKKNTSTNQVAHTIEGARHLVADKLQKRAEEKVEEQKGNTYRGHSKKMLEVIDQCRNPIMVSCMAHNMAHKKPEEYLKEEENIAHRFSKFSTNLKEDLTLIGDMEPVKAILVETMKDKEKILQDKAKDFVTTATAEVVGALTTMCEKTKKEKQILENSDIAQLDEQQGKMMAQMNGIKGDVSKNFISWNDTLDAKKVACVAKLRKEKQACTELSTHTGEKEVQKSYTVSGSTWYKPWTWFSKETRYYTTTENYQYLLATDATRQIGVFIDDAISEFEALFQQVVSPKEIRRELLTVVTNHIDMTSEAYDQQLILDMVQQLVDKLELPVIAIQSKPIMRKISSQFSGEVRHSEMDKLQAIFQETLGDSFDLLSAALQDEIRRFKNTLGETQKGFQEQLLKDINDEYEKLKKESKEKDKEVKRKIQYINQLEAECKNLQGVI